jgi:outer membrane protein TolC
MLAASMLLCCLAPITSPALQAQEAREEVSRTLTLDDAVEIGLTRSPAVRQARAQLRRDAAGEWEGWDRLLPSLTFSSGLNQTEVLQQTASDPITGGIVLLPDSLIQVRETFGTQALLSADWTLFDGGGNVSALRRARADSRAAEAAFQAANVRVAAGVTLAFLDALEAQAREDGLRAEVARAEELYRTASGRFDVGEVPELDALQARLQASDAEINLMEAESQTYSARLALFEYLDIEPDVAVLLAEPVATDLDRLPPEEELRRRATEESRDLEERRARLDAARRSHDAQRLWFLPSMSLGVTWARSEFGQSRDAITWAPRNEHTSYRLNFSWNPLARPGGTVADRRRSAGNVRLAEAELELQEAVLVRGVEAALDRLSRARALRERSEVNLRLAERQRQQAEERYRLGVAPLLERLNAEALAAEAERQAILARYAALRALAELEQASGVGFRSFL